MIAKFQTFWGWRWTTLLFMGATLLLMPVAAFAAVRGDFNNDGTVNLSDLSLFVAQFHRNNTVFSLTGSDSYVDLLDYNELLKELQSSNPPPVTLQSSTACSQRPINNGTDATHEYLNVVSFNIGGRIHLNNSTSLNALADMIIANRVDIAAFQEVADAPDGSNRVNEALVAILRQKQYPTYTSSQEGGVSIISRFPLSSHRILTMAGGSNGPGGGYGFRAAITDLATTPGSAVRLFNHHQHFDSGCIQLYPYFWDLINTYNDKNMIAFGDLNSTLASYLDPKAGEQCKGGSAYGKSYDGLPGRYLDFSCQPGYPCSSTNQQPDWVFIPRMPNNIANQATIVESCLKGEYSRWTTDGHIPRFATVKITK